VRAKVKVHTKVRIHKRMVTEVNGGRVHTGSDKVVVHTAGGGEGQGSHRGWEEWSGFRQMHTEGGGKGRVHTEGVGKARVHTGGNKW
jgi:hypothetical protein